MHFVKCKAENFKVKYLLYYKNYKFKIIFNIIGDISTKS